MSLFEEIFGKKTPEENYKEKYGENETQIIQDETFKAITLKREGNFKGANEIYIDLNNKFGSNPVILKSWAKILVCLGRYDNAIEKYQEASKLYREIGSGEYWQCDSQLNKIKNRHDNSQEFKGWVSAISGGSISPNEVKL